MQQRLRIFWQRLQSAAIAHPARLLGSAMAFFVAANFSFVWLKFRALQYDGLDLAIFTQTLWQTLHGIFFGATIHPPSYLADHFSPFLLVLAPLFALWSSSLLLLLLQVIGLAASVWPFYYLARRWLPAGAALAASAAWLANPLLWNVAAFEFSPLAFLPLLLLAVVVAGQAERWRWFWVFVGLTLLVREDASLLLIGLGVWLLLERRWRVGSAVLVISSVWLLASLYLISWANPESSYKFFVYYTWLGETPRAALLVAVLQPWRVLGHLASVGNIEMLLGLLGVSLLLPLWGKRGVFLLLLPLLQMMLGVSGGNALVLEMHYAALFLPGLAVASLLGLRRLLQPAEVHTIFRRILREPNLLRIMAAAAVLYNLIVFSPVLAWPQLWQTQSAPDLATKRWLLAGVPDHAAVATTYEFLPALAARRNLYSWHYVASGEQQFGRSGYALPEVADLLAVDTQEYLLHELQFSSTNRSAQAFGQEATRVRRLLAERGFAACRVRDTFVLWSKQCQHPIELYRVSPQLQPSVPDIDTIYFSATVAQQTLQTDGLGPRLDLHLRFFAKQPSPQVVHVRFEALQAGEAVYQRDVPLAYGLYPTTDWQAGEQIDVWYALNLPADVAARKPKLRLRFFTQNGFVTLNRLRRLEAVQQTNYLEPVLALPAL